MTAAKSAGMPQMVSTIKRPESRLFGGFLSAVARLVLTIYQPRKTMPSNFKRGLASPPIRRSGQGCCREQAKVTIYGLSGGAERWLRIPLDLSQPPITFAVQALAAVRRTPTVPFFGTTKGFIVNSTPDNAVEFGTNGAPVQTFEKAYRPDEVEIFIGKQRVPAAGLLGAGGVQPP